MLKKDVLLQIYKIQSYYFFTLPAFPEKSTAFYRKGAVFIPMAESSLAA